MLGLLPSKSSLLQHINMSVDVFTIPSYGTVRAVPGGFLVKVYNPITSAVTSSVTVKLKALLPIY